MGYILKAECRICNYETTAKFGGGRFDYQTNNPVPAYNKVTEEIESVNYKTEKDNLNYLFYTDKELKGKNEGNNIFRNFDLLLNQKDNFCPNCKNNSLDFYTYLFC
jgi:hypothetical protein